MSTTEQVLMEGLDELTRRYTAFDSFDALLTAPGGYRPGFDVRKEPLRILANEYDQAQAARGDARRASRMFDRPKWVSFMYPGPETKYLPVLRAHEVAMDVLVDAAILDLPITRREAYILACYIVTEQAAATVPPSFLPVLHQSCIAAELFVMLTLIGRDRWTWGEAYTAAWGYVQQLRIRQPFFTEPKRIRRWA